MQEHTIRMKPITGHSEHVPMKQMDEANELTERIR